MRRGKRKIIKILVVDPDMNTREKLAEYYRKNYGRGSNVVIYKAKSIAEAEEKIALHNIQMVLFTQDFSRADVATLRGVLSTLGDAVHFMFPPPESLKSIVVG